LIDRSTALIVATDLKGSIVYYNYGASRSLGYTLDEIIGRSVVTVYPDLDEAKSGMAALRDPGHGGPGIVQTYQTTFAAKAGERIPVAMSATINRDETGEPDGTIGFAKDLRAILHKDQLATLGEVAVGLSHEINNPLAYLRANLNLLRQHWDALGIKLEKTLSSQESSELIVEGAEMIDESLEGVERAAAIVRDVRGLAHAGSKQWETADLNGLIDGVLRMAAPQLRDHVGLEKCYGARPQVLCAPQELQQVFLNLVLHAGQAVGRSGTIRLITDREPSGVVVRVEDDGCGIPADAISRIFDPFFTTKEVGEGTGLGLGIAYGIVQQHGGDIFVEPSPGGGTLFSVHLPVAADTIDTP